MILLLLLSLFVSPARAQSTTVQVSAEVKNLKIIDEICEDGQIDDCLQVRELTEEEREWIEQMRRETEERQLDY